MTGEGGPGEVSDVMIKEHDTTTKKKTIFGILYKKLIEPLIFIKINFFKLQTNKRKH